MPRWYGSLPGNKNMEKTGIERLEAKIQYTFKDKALLRNALTHSSYANESRVKGVSSNERLEFLGDSVLGLISSDYIFRLYRDIPEGELTKLRAALVCEQALHEQALAIGLNEFILLGHGEEAGGGRQRVSILADATEALIGAIYLDGGMEAARSFVLSFVKPNVKKQAHEGNFHDYKTMLQEIVQKNREETLSYRLAGQEGPDHDKTFCMEVLLNSNVMASGIGHSKKEAEQAAAEAALRLMGIDV